MAGVVRPQPFTASSAEARTPLLTCAETAGSSGGVNVAVRGDLDLVTGPTLRRRLLQLFALPLEWLVLDLRGVGFLDSAGLSVLTWARNEAAARGIGFALASVPDRAREVMRMAGDESFDFLPNA